MIDTVAAMCLALTMYHEARGEGPVGMLAVGQVVMNRTIDARWPDDICGVVRQGGERRYRCQFSWYCDGESDQPTDPASWQLSVQLAERLLAGDVKFVSLSKATCYHATWLPRVPGWTTRSKPIKTVGLHRFYQC